MKVLEENLGVNFHQLRPDDGFLGMIPKPEITK